MANLFWKKGKKIINLNSVPFKSEEEFEKFIFNTKEIFADIFLLDRQIRGGAKKDIPDIIGIDQDGNVCIIEMKNVEVNQSIIPQVLSYAIWAKDNPDSIKSLWLQSAETPEIEINWDNYEVRILIIAPSIDPSTLKFINSISYTVELIEVKRWIEGENSFLLVNQLESKIYDRVKTVRGVETYDKDFYESYRNKKSVQVFLNAVKETTEIIRQRGWNLETKFNKNYCAFKYGFFNAFQIKWTGSKSLAFSFKIPQNVAKLYKNLTPTKFHRDYVLYNINLEKPNVKKYIPLMILALDHSKIDE